MRTLSFRTRGDKALAQQYRWAGERLFRQLSDGLDLVGSYSGTLHKFIDGVRITARVIGGNGVVTIEAPEGGGGKCEEDTFSPETWFWVDPTAVGNEYSIGKKAGWFAGPEVPENEVTYGRYYWVGGARSGVAVCRTTGARRSVAGKVATPHVVSWLSTTAYALGQRLFVAPSAATIYAAWYYGGGLICVAGATGVAQKCYRVTLGETPETATFETLATWPFDFTNRVSSTYPNYVPMSVKSDGTHGVYAWRHAEAHVNLSRDDDGNVVAAVTASKTTVTSEIRVDTTTTTTYTASSTCSDGVGSGVALRTTQTVAGNAEPITLGLAYDYADVLHRVTMDPGYTSAESEVSDEGTSPAGTASRTSSGVTTIDLTRGAAIYRIDGEEIGRYGTRFTIDRDENLRYYGGGSISDVQVTETDNIADFWWHPYSNSYGVTKSQRKLQTAYSGTKLRGALDLSGGVCGFTVPAAGDGYTSTETTKDITTTTSVLVLAGQEVLRARALSGPDAPSVQINGGAPVTVPGVYTALPGYGDPDDPNNTRVDEGSIEVYASDLSVYAEGVDYALLDTDYPASHISLLEGGEIESGTVVAIRWTVNRPPVNVILQDVDIEIGNTTSTTVTTGYTSVSDSAIGEPYMYSPDQSPNTSGRYAASNGHGSILKLATEGYLVPLPFGPVVNPLEVLGLDPTTYQVGAT